LSFSFLLRVFSSRQSRIPSKETNSLSQQSFGAVGVSAPVVDALAARGIHAPFKIQTLVLPEALAGADVLAKSPTGSGKTLAFGVPVVERTHPEDDAPAALVLVPTRELAQQVADELEPIAAARGIGVVAVYGGAPVSAQARSAQGMRIVIATPGRLQDLVERRRLSLDGVRILVLDEADRMLDMGFKPQVERIVRRLPRDRQTMLFSATLDGEVGELARSLTRDPARIQVDAATMAQQGEVEHRYVEVTADSKVARLVQELAGLRGLALVFVRTKRGADRLVHKLAGHEVTALALHGDMAQSQRERALMRFRTGAVDTLVATDVAARGLDLDDITHVINFDPPEDDRSYVHRVGRTGRAGRSGNGITLVLPEQRVDMSRVAVRLGHREQFQEGGMPVAPARKVYSSRRGRHSRW
jgi:ATP-dependent RNA helicase RhlE